jgi:hypothetical protein
LSTYDDNMRMSLGALFENASWQRNVEDELDRASRRREIEIEREHAALLDALARNERARSRVARERQTLARLQTDVATLEDGTVIRWTKSFRDAVTGDLGEQVYTYVALRVNGLWYHSGFSATSREGRRMGKTLEKLVAFMVERGEVHGVELVTGWKSIV